MKIIALLPVKNEAWVLRHCLNSLSFCDEILAINDNSIDETLDILNEFNCTIIPLDTSTDIGWKEYQIRNQLLTEARKRQATHIVAIDGDEMFSNIFTSTARDILSHLNPGEALALPWIDVKSEDTILPIINKKVFILADNQKVNFTTAFMHVPRVPDVQIIQTLNIPNVVLHFQHVHLDRFEYKRIWYMLSEYENKERNALRINVRYHVTRHDSITFNIQSMISDGLPDPSLDKGFWQKEKVFAILNLNTCVHFERLNIWHLPEMRQKFIDETGRLPRPFITPRWLLFINKWKNVLPTQIRNLIH